MPRLFVFQLANLFTLTVLVTSTFGQGGGSYGGAGSDNEQRLGSASVSDQGQIWQSPFYVPMKSSDPIRVTGTSAIRVPIEGIRLVLAVTAEGDSANACQQEVAEDIAAIRTSWLQIGIQEADVVEDFISLLPRYVWGLEDRGGESFRVQQRDGYRMQTNLHVAVKTEEQAMQVIQAGFGETNLEVITFDYWSSKLDEEKQKAIAAALTAAQQKSEILLAVFEEKPKVINVLESTIVSFPASMYTTYENVLEEDWNHWNSDKPSIKAFRPKMTFYRGLGGGADTGPKTAAMHPEIGIVSTVQILYQSPASDQDDAEDDSSRCSQAVRN